ncbi:MAG: inverse autotransporter beta domain-containing protein [Gammaproteobacteria bacterium]
MTIREKSGMPVRGRQWRPVACAFALATLAAAMVAGGAEKPAGIPAAQSQSAASPAAAFTLTDYHLWRDNIAQPANDSVINDSVIPASLSNDNLRESANGGEAAAFDKPLSAQSALVHNTAANNGILRTFLIDTANTGGGDAFANFYQNAQINLFSSLEDHLARRGEQALLTNFSAIKKAQINLQTELGNRKANLGINIIGALAANETNAIGWQIRAYGTEDSGKGFNTGLFLRHKTAEESIIGINAFLDYERVELNNQPFNFLRYSIGGEVRHELASFAANYYLPISSDKGGVNNATYFTREGYDGKVRIAIPKVSFLQAAVDYYNFEGKGTAAEQKGIRYGAEAHFLPGLRVGILYDKEDKQLGGEISYAHTIGESPQSQHSADAAPFAPDFFAPVWREHSQRIAENSGAIVINTTFFSDAINPATVAVLAAGVGDLAAGVDYSFAASGPNFTLSSNILLFRFPQQVNQRAYQGDMATVVASDNNGESPLLTMFFRITAIPPMTARFNYESRGFVSGAGETRVSVGNVHRVFGGLPPYNYELVAGAGSQVFNITATNSVVAVIPAGNPVPATFPPTTRPTPGTIRINDSSPLTPPIEVAFAVDASSPISVSVEYRHNAPYTVGANYFGTDPIYIHTSGGRPVSGEGDRLRDGYYVTYDFINRNYRTFIDFILRNQGRPHGIGSFRNNVLTAGTITLFVRVDDDSNIGGRNAVQPDDLTPPVQITALLTVVAAQP